MTQNRTSKVADNYMKASPKPKENTETQKTKEANNMQEQYKEIISDENVLSATEWKSMKKPKETKSKRITLLVNPSIHKQVLENSKLKGENMNTYITNAIIDTILKDMNLTKSS